MQTTANELINDLQARLDKAGETVRRFNTLGIKEMNARKTAGSWSLLECLEHLNLYGDFYLPEIEATLLANKQLPAAENFKSGLIGNYFAKLMQVNNGKLKKMKTPSSMNPAGSELSVITIERLLKQLRMLRSLLEQSRHTDLVKAKTAIALTKLVRLRLGDTFRFLVYHIERHVLQAQQTQGPFSTTAPSKAGIHTEYHL